MCLVEARGESVLYTADFAATLRELGYDAQPFSEQDQLTLPFGDFRGLRPAAQGGGPGGSHHGSSAR
jgi:hypothetical protein